MLKHRTFFKVFAAIFVIFAMHCIYSDTVIAQANSENGGNFGIGVMFGEPAGISIKSWNGARSAFDVGAAWSLTGRNEAVHLHADVLLHSWFSDIDVGRLAFYYGLGGRIIFAGDATAGVRFPLGLNYVFQTIPFDIFVEAVPIFDVTPDTKFAGNGAIGIRYYF
ncbi:MAG: hypothetical protein WD267_10495 [Balneolales bacterium]